MTNKLLGARSTLKRQKAYISTKHKLRSIYKKYGTTVLKPN